jgi:hypothetical protein
MPIQFVQPEYFVLWVTPKGEKVPFEVSREVAGTVHPRCPNSPFCPGERIYRIEGMPAGGARRVSTATPDFDPEFEYHPARCPYRYRSKEECFQAINRQAIRSGCIPEPELERTAGFFKSLGYRVKAERVPTGDLEGARILLAHRPIYNFHELRVEHCIGGQILYLIRNPSLDESPPDCEEM